MSRSTILHFKTNIIYNISYINDVSKILPDKEILGSHEDDIILSCIVTKNSYLKSKKLTIFV